MGKNIAEKIISAHLIDGKMEVGENIAIRIDQTLTQDATGTMSYLQFEALGLKKVKTELSVSYVDHNMLQSGFENADDHKYLQSVASKYGIYFSRPGNGICHQVHLERFGAPGKTLLGSDSHTPTGGGIGMMAMGAGGLDVAVAMGGGAFHLSMPEVVNVFLTGKLKPFVTAKDIILEVLRVLSVKGGVGRVIEYGGPGVKKLTVPQRATITNMGAELGATTSIFPSDENTKAFMKLQKRAKNWVPLEADKDAKYAKVIKIDLSKLEPMIAKPHSPDSVVKVKAIKRVKVDQVCIGSCTNSSITDLMITASLLKGKKVHTDVSCTISPGSKQVFEAIADNGALTDLIASGARIIESGCGPCIGMGQAPSSGAVSVRSFNRNFPGRSGTKDAQVFLASPETCVAAAITGYITDPRELKTYPKVKMPEKMKIDDSGILEPSETPGKVKILRGPNIQPLPINTAMSSSLEGEVLLITGDNVTTDHIMPAGAKVLPLRSNIPKIAEFVYYMVDSGFVSRCKEKGGGFIIGGDNYGQGSSREHAALAPMYLGIKMVLTKSFARIHLANLINFGILPLTFADPADYKKIEQGDKLKLPLVSDIIATGADLTVKNITKKFDIQVTYSLTPRQVQIVRAGGLLNYTRGGGK
ncbi:MAG: aconitate hydratase [candidate division Zixibacteria bacterium]|nr:aconitate hydratase [candidate division Zixibacteria bacterium]